MAQHDYIISNQTFPNTRADINNLASAIATNNSGTSAPTTQYAGQFWIDTTSSTWTLYIHDGTDDIQFATIDTSANTVNFTDSALDVVTDTTPQLGGNLDLNSNDITGTGNINITGTATVSGDLTVDTNTLYVDSADNRVGIGTTSPLAQLEVNSGNGDTNSIFKSTDNNCLIIISDDDSSSTIAVESDGSGGVLKFNTGGNGSYANNSEAMRIDSSGNVLVGTTDDAPANNGTQTSADDGFVIKSDGNFQVAKYNSTPAYINRTGSTGGTLVDFRGNGATAGIIGVNSANHLFMGKTDTGLVFQANETIAPYNVGTLSYRDNEITLGGSTGRFKDFYLGGNIYLGGTGSANALDDYEEGNWTPTVGYGTITTASTYYTKIGNIVHVRATISSVSDITTSVNFILNGLPFTSVGETSGGVMSRYINTTIGGDAYCWFIPNGSTGLSFYNTANNSDFEAIQHADITSTSTQFYIMATYRTS